MIETMVTSIKRTANKATNAASEMATDAKSKALELVGKGPTVVKFDEDQMDTALADGANYWTRLRSGRFQEAIDDCKPVKKAVKEEIQTA